MTPPPIRYPLPTLILLILVGILTWRGSVWTRPIRQELARRWERLVFGPPVPASTKPQGTGIVTGRGLLLKDGTPVFDAPRGTALAPIARRGFVLIYDTWSSQGETAPPEFYRIGNRVPIGWVASGDLLKWDSRLVILPPAGGRLLISDQPVGETRTVNVPRLPIPVLDWNDQAVKVLIWAADRPWSKPDRTAWIALDQVDREAKGVLVAKVELPALLGLAIRSREPADAARTRLRAILGELLETPGWTDTEVAEAYRSLPPFLAPQTVGAAPTARLAAINADANASEVNWGDQAFVFVPLDALP